MLEGKGSMKIETKDVVDIGDEVWIKVCEVEPEAGDNACAGNRVSFVVSCQCLHWPISLS